MSLKKKVGVPKEIKNNENRVGMLPSGVKQLVNHGHTVYVETNAGSGIGLTDDDYRAAGAEILSSLEAVFEASDVIVKVKEPQPREIKLFKPHHLVITYLHLAADKKLTEDLMNTGATFVAYETIQLPDGSLPLLSPMSEVAGRMASQVGADYLQKVNGGKGMLLGGVPGVRRAKVTVIGCGIAGINSIKMAMGLGADVTAIDLSPKRLAYLDDVFETRITTLYSNPHNIEEAVVNSDLVIGAVLIPGAKAPKLVTRELIGKMEAGSVVVDIAVDQGGCIETCKPTTHEDPTFVVDGVVHYCVANMPGAVPLTSTHALTGASLDYIKRIVNDGLEEAVKKDPVLRGGVNIYNGKVVYKQVADDHNLPLENLSF